MATIVKKAVKKAVAQSEDFKIMDISNVEFLSPGGGGGGRTVSPEVQKLIQAAMNLKVGQGFKIPDHLRISREINGKNGKSVLYTYKGAATLMKRAKSAGKKFRTRRDVNQNLWLFRVEPLEEAVDSEE